MNISPETQMTAESETPTGVHPALQGLNQEQLDAATCLENVVAAAGAGSGKTHVLSHRYAWLVTEQNYKPEEILTLTFTTKAASEMYQRIYATLCSLRDDPEPVIQHRATEAIASFHKARISTLDSYCNTIVRDGIHHFGISHDFSIDKAAAESLAETMALPFVLSNKDNQALKQLMGSNNPAEAASAFFAKAVTAFSNLANPRNFEADTEKQSVFAAKRWSELTGIVTKIYSDIYTNLKSDDASTIFTPTFLKNGAPLFADTEPGSLLTPPAYSDSPDTLRKYLDFVYRFAKLELRGIRGVEKQDNPIFISRRYCTELHLLFNYKVCYDTNMELSRLLNAFQKEYHEQRRQQGILTFTDVSQFALRLLKEYPEIRAQEKNAFKAIMIDEFQDDNEIQRDLLYLISERKDVITQGVPEAKDLDQHKLFFVGDEKQSIYKFRGADVSVFMKLRSEMPQYRTLRTNYRSKENLLKGFNVLCHPTQNPDAPLFSWTEAPDTDAFTYEARYENARFFEKNQENPESQDMRRITIALKQPDENQNPDMEYLNDHQVQARYIADIINRKVAEEGYQYSDFAILERKTTEQQEYERILREAGIPYTTEKVSGFFGEAVINDIASCLQLLIHPDDTMAYSSLLLSPLVNLSSAGVTAILTNPFSKPFDSASEQYLSDSDKEQFCKGRAFFEGLIAEKSQLSSTHLVSHIWYTCGYRYQTVWNENFTMYESLFDLLFETARRCDAENRTIADYTQQLMDIRQSYGEYLEDVEIPMEQRNAVKIMTIHKSKGLQFPVVFIPELNQNPPGNSNFQVIYSYFSEKYGLVPNTGNGLPVIEINKIKGNWFAKAAASENMCLEQAELRRLLYVAMTRAEDELIMTGADDGSFGKNNGKVDEWSIFTEKTHTQFIHLLSESLQRFTGMQPEESPFIYKVIPAMEAEFVTTGSNTTGFENQQKAIEAARNRYPSEEQQKQKIEADMDQEPIRANPSTFGHGDYNPEDAASSSGERPAGLFDTTRLETLIASQKAHKQESEPFAENDFGTIAHAKAEQIFTGHKVAVPKNIAAKLKAEDLAAVEKLAQEMADHFVTTPIGEKALKASLRKSEYTFKTRIVNDAGIPVLVDGQIDLVFDCPEDNVLYVVDFKSDQAIEPEKHTTQLAFYKRSAEQMFTTAKTGRQVRCYLYYLRYGKTVDCTEAATGISLENLTASSN